MSSNKFGLRDMILRLVPLPALLLLVSTPAHATYVMNDPMNNIDPTGMCKNDSKCDGNFNAATSTPTGRQTNDGLQDYFNFRANPKITDTYVTDPQAFGVEELIDVGTQIQSSIQNNGRARKYYDQAIANGGNGTFVMNNVAFGQSLWTIGSTAGQGIGRFSGDVSGTISVADDGTYTVQATMTFDYGAYDWTPDRNNIVGNIAISLGGARWNVPGPGRVKADKRGRPISKDARRYRTGVTFTPVPNRTYNFTAWGSN